MDEQALNKKLAEWRFPDAKTITIDEQHIFVVFAHGNEVINLFTQSTDACFKWLVPKLRAEGYFTVLRDLLDNFRCNLVAEDSTKKSWYGRAETPALALCLAIEKLINLGEESGKQ